MNARRRGGGEGGATLGIGVGGVHRDRRHPGLRRRARLEDRQDGRPSSVSALTLRTFSTKTPASKLAVATPMTGAITIMNRFIIGCFSSSFVPACPASPT